MQLLARNRAGNSVGVSKGELRWEGHSASCSVTSHNQVDVNMLRRSRPHVH
jgi:hypothetical protein